MEPMGRAAFERAETGAEQLSMGALLSPRPAAEGVEGYDENGDLINPATAEGAVSADAARRLDEIAYQINMRERNARDVFKATAIEIGKYLVEAQGLCPRGRWSEWLRQKVDYSDRKAQQLMQVYEAYGDKALTGDYDALSFTQIYQLLSAPEESRDDLARRAADEGLSTRQLKAEIERLRAEAGEAQQRMEIETAAAYREGADHGAQAMRDDYEAMRKRAEEAEARADAAEASMGAIRSTAAAANDRAADAEEELREANAAFDKRTREMTELHDKNVALQEALAKAEAEWEKLEAENRRLRKAPPVAPVAPVAPSAPEGGADLDALMDAVKGSLTRMVAAIKEAQEGRPSEAAAKKNELAAICVAIAKKIGGMQNE